MLLQLRFAGLGATLAAALAGQLFTAALAALERSALSAFFALLVRTFGS